MSFLSEPEQAELQEVLVQKASAVKSKTNDSSDCSGTTISDGNKTSEPPVKRRMSVLDRLLGDEEKEEEDLSVLEEVKLYLQERPIKRREDPLCWWRVNGSRFPHLEILARKYLAIPATSTPSERVFSVAGIVVDKRRSAFTAEMIDALVFLNKNSFLLGLTDQLPTIPKPDLILEIDNESDGEEEWRISKTKKPFKFSVSSTIHVRKLEARANRKFRLYGCG